MPGRRSDSNLIARRQFLHSLAWAPAIFLPAPLRIPLALARPRSLPAFPFDDRHVVPTYTAPSPLDDVLRLVTPGLDQFALEGQATDIQQVLQSWATQLCNSHRDLRLIAPQIHPAI